MDSPEASAKLDKNWSNTVRALVTEHASFLNASREVWFAGIVAAVVLTASRYHATTSEFRRLFRPLLTAPHWPFGSEGSLAFFVRQTVLPIADHLYWFFGSALLFFVIPLALGALVPGLRLRAFGLGVGDWRYGLKATAFLYLAMLPVVVLVSFNPRFSSHYPLAQGARTSIEALALYELGYWTYFVGWEFIYRGLLCVGLYPRLGASALILQSIPFAVMHGGKPEVEAFGAIVAGLALGVLAVRARSFWYGALLHSLVATTMDVLSLIQTGRWPSG